mmetsp:Transcript_3548/g.9364  ORF Transcript_3548/g.9364 Transcript_3548/m.9364 type:complete len:1591 (-) Transcript_3548:489-5261(-)
MAESSSGYSQESRFSDEGNIGMEKRDCDEASEGAVADGGKEMHLRSQKPLGIKVNLPGDLEGELDNLRTPTSAASGGKGADREGPGLRRGTSGINCEGAAFGHASPGRRRRRVRKQDAKEGSGGHGAREHDCVSAAAGKDCYFEFEFGGRRDGEGNDVHCSRGARQEQSREEDADVRRPESRRGQLSSTSSEKAAARKWGATSPVASTHPSRLQQRLQQRVGDEEPLMQAQMMQGHANRAPVHVTDVPRKKELFRLGASPKLNARDEGRRARQREASPSISMSRSRSKSRTKTFRREGNGSGGWLEGSRRDGQARLSPPLSRLRPEQEQQRRPLRQHAEEANIRAEQRGRGLDLVTMDHNAKQFTGGSTQSARAARKSKSEGNRSAAATRSSAVIHLEVAEVRRKTAEFSPPDFGGDSEREHMPTDRHSLPDDAANDENFDGEGNDDKDVGVSSPSPNGPPVVLDLMSDEEEEEHDDAAEDSELAGCRTVHSKDRRSRDVNSKDDSGNDDNAYGGGKHPECHYSPEGNMYYSNGSERYDNEKEKGYSGIGSNIDIDGDDDDDSKNEDEEDDRFESVELESTERPCARTRAKKESRKKKGKEGRGWSGKASSSAAKAISAASFGCANLVEVDLYGGAGRDDGRELRLPLPVEEAFDDGNYGSGSGSSIDNGDEGGSGGAGSPLLPVMKKAARAVGGAAKAAAGGLKEGTRGAAAVLGAMPKRGNPLASRRGNPINAPGSSLATWKGRRYTDPDDGIASFHSSPSPQAKTPKKKRKTKGNSDVQPQVWEELRKDNMKRTPNGDLKGSFSEEKAKSSSRPSSSSDSNSNSNGIGNGHGSGNKRRKREGGQKSVFDYLGNEKEYSQQSRARSNGIAASSFHSRMRTGRDGERGARRNQGRDRNRNQDRDRDPDNAATWRFFREESEKVSTHSAGERTLGKPADRQKDEVILIDDSDDSDDDGFNDKDEGHSGAGTLSSDQHALNKKMSEEDQYRKALKKSRLDQSRRYTHPLRRRKSPRLRVTGDRYKCEAVRIAVGKKVFSSMCMLQFQPGAGGPYLLVEFTPRGDGAKSKSDCKSRAAACAGTRAGAGVSAVSRVQSMKISVEDMLEMKYFISSADSSPSDDGDGSGDAGNSRSAGNGGGRTRETCRDMSFLSMRIQPTEENGLTQYSSAYLQNGEDKDKAGNGNRNISGYGNGSGQAKEMERRYVVVEARHDDELKEILEKMRENSILQAFLTKDAQLLSDGAGVGAKISRYAATLIDDSKKEEERRLRSLALSPSVSKKTTRLRRGVSASASDKGSSNGGSKTHLVFPFASAEDSEQIYNQAARRLYEASGALVSFQDDNSDGLEAEDDEGNCDRPRALVWRPMQCSVVGEKGEQAGSSEKGGSTKVRSAGRTHHLTIRSEDVDRLEPGEFLNDTLIDFWMRWIWRHDNPITSPVYFFTSHFFTTLLEEGPEAVSSWTSKKGIDIFEKDFVFLPINESLHWSLCVIVNPGFIMNALQEGQEDDNSDSGISEDARCPCILFLDSLKAHRKARVAAWVRKWLNFEAKRLQKFNEANTDTPFNTTSMRVYDPRSKCPDIFLNFCAEFTKSVQL